MNKKLRVAVLFGGKSGEHDVSLSSAASVIQSMDLDKYEVIPMGITKEGAWLSGPESINLISSHLNNRKLERLKQQLHDVPYDSEDSPLPYLRFNTIDVVFPVLHGTYGEDGTIQGLLEIANLPYVGAGVLASASSMDKVFAKKMMEQAGLPQGQYTYFLKSEIVKNIDVVLEQVENACGYPCFVKPANLGSSVGISKANNPEELIESLNLAAKYDRKVIVEAFIPAHEVEVAVLGNDVPQASIPGEIVSSNEFYDYKAKYIDGKSKVRIPAELSAEVLEKIRNLALKAYKVLDCSGLARVDFFIHRDSGEILVNEMNTLPGFTPYSMYPKLWEHSGIGYSELVDKLIDLAIERYHEKSGLITSFEVK